MEVNIFQISAVLGLIFIIIAILFEKPKKQYTWFIAGGILLTVYSVYLKDLIFIFLQIIFTLAAAYKLIKSQQKKK